jgi:hypothetical protein
VIPNTVTSIGNYAFNGCKDLATIALPNSVTNVGSGAFKECGLTSVTIPSGVTNIGAEAFYRCSRLVTITALATTAPTVQNNTFKYVRNSGGTLYVPQGSSGYDTWMQNASYYLGYYNWTKVEQ